MQTANYLLENSCLNLSTTIVELSGLHFMPYNAHTEKPTKKQWAKAGNKDRLLDWLIEGCWSETDLSCQTPAEPEEVEYEGYDGFYNNLARTDLGAVGM
jgi:hypothetical protein